MHTLKLALISTILCTTNAFAQVKPCQIMWTVDEKGDSVSFIVVEKMPFLTEGIEPYIKWMNENMDKKLISKRKEEKKTVYVRFIVREDGSTFSFMIEKGLGESYDKEALRLVMNNPQTWTAGECEGKKVKTRMIIPVKF